jgi:hypothetical protein
LTLAQSLKKRLLSGSPLLKPFDNFPEFPVVGFSAFAVHGGIPLDFFQAVHKGLKPVERDGAEDSTRGENLL